LKLFGSFWRSKGEKIAKGIRRKWGSGGEEGYLLLKMKRKFTEIFICAIIKGK